MLRWRIIGCGKIAGYFAEDLRLVDGHILQAVASRSLPKAEAFGNANQALTSYGDYTSLFEDEEVDVVYIATPHNSHMEWAIKAMNSGKHVLCEKPLAVNSHQVEKMIAASQANQVFLMEALWSRFNPTIKEVKQRCDEGELGELRYLNADFSFYSELNESSRLYNPALAGGALLDVGIYPIFLAYLILGTPQGIKATSQICSTGVDGQTSIILEYPDSNALLFCGLNCNLENRAVISGTQGRIVIPGRWHEAEGYIKYVSKDDEHFTIDRVGRGYYYEIQEVGKCIKQGLMENPDWSHHDSLQVCTIMDGVRSQIGLKYPFESEVSD